VIRQQRHIERNFSVRNSNTADVTGGKPIAI
jgi:hypothetical protein